MTGSLVIGVGNPDRGDDGAGIAVVRRLRQRGPAGVAVVEAEGEASALIEAWSGKARVVVVDAASSGQRPGNVRRFDARRESLPARHLHASTHAWGVAEAVEMARALGSLPESLVVDGIEGRSFGPGEGLSPGVQAAIDEVVERILTEVEGA